MDFSKKDIKGVVQTLFKGHLEKNVTLVVNNFFLKHLSFVMFVSNV